MAGLNFDPLSLYPATSLPVPTATPMLSSLVRWDHSDNWDVPTEQQFLALGSASAGGSGGAAAFEIDITPGTEDEYLVGHAIDGRVLFPATGYLVLAWKQLARTLNQQFGQSAIAFEDVGIHRATILPPSGRIPYYLFFFLNSRASYWSERSPSRRRYPRFNYPERTMPLLPVCSLH